MNKWIKCSERLPENEGDYLCFEDGYYEVLSFDKHATWDIVALPAFTCSEGIVRKPSHWMLLPDSPKDTP